MRILFTRFPLSSRKGGLENQTLWLGEGLREKGHSIGFLGSCPVLYPLMSDAGFEATQLTIGPPPVTKWSAVSFAWRQSAMKRRLIAALEAMPTLPDTIIMLSFSEKLLMTDWLAARGVRVIWIEHDRIGRWLRWSPWLALFCHQSAHATVVCVSQLSRTMCERLGINPKRLAVITNGIPLPSSASVPEEKTGPGAVLRTLGCVARLSPEKGVDILIEAIADLPDWSLEIVGNGPDESEIRRLIAEDTVRLGLGFPRIRLRSSVSDLDSFYRGLTAFVLPSADHDPFGLVAAEAMARGVPTIVTDACGIAIELRDRQDALIVPAGSARELSKAIASLSDPELLKRLSESGSAVAASRFGLPAMIDAYDKLLRGAPEKF